MLQWLHITAKELGILYTVDIKTQTAPSGKGNLPQKAATREQEIRLRKIMAGLSARQLLDLKSYAENLAGDITST